MTVTITKRIKSILILFLNGLTVRHPNHDDIGRLEPLLNLDPRIENGSSTNERDVSGHP